MTNDRLKISVVIPVYNQANYIAEAIESILNQTQKTNEIIVVDDGSTDDLKTALKPYLNAIQIIHHQTNLGVAAARNKGINAANFDVILFQDADDISMPKRVEQTLKSLSDPTVFYVRGMLQNFLEIGQALPQMLADKENLTPMPSIGAGVLTAKKEVFGRVGMFDENLTVAEDLDWEMRAKAKGFSPFILEELLIKRRLHSANTSHLNAEEAAAARLKIFRKNLFPRK